MRFALVNPNWKFEGSVYFGCQLAHLPLEFGYSKALLEAQGHEAYIIDAQARSLSLDALYNELDSIRPDITVLTTAPSYLFWRCPPPELRTPNETASSIKDVAGALGIVGPHSSTTPEAVLKKTGADFVLAGECESALAEVGRLRSWKEAGCAYFPGRKRSEVRMSSTADMTSFAPLKWPDETVRKHTHQHHRFDALPTGPGAEIEASRGCPYNCTFCSKKNFRNRYRKRCLAAVIEELNSLVSQGVEYVYFIDEIFMPDRRLLEAIAMNNIKFGIQTRIDLWKPEMIKLLGEAGCVSIEAGVESISEEGRALLNKNCSISTDEIMKRLVYARKKVPFVQATLLDLSADQPDAVENWRQYMICLGIWVNQPVPLFPFPGSEEYLKRWGEPDELAWERAHDFYLDKYNSFSDIQSSRPLPLKVLESACHGR